MKLGFEESQAVYQSETQNVRALSEHWFHSNGFCPSCGNAQLSRFPNNTPVADFACGACGEQFELKSQKGKFGTRIVDGAYAKMIERIQSADSPNFFLMNYDRRIGVSDLIVVPKHFFVPEVIEKRKPLGPSARRAGWTGCNILFRAIPDSGKIFIVRNSIPQSPAEVQGQWRQCLFLRDQKLASRGWLLTTMKTVEMINQPEFWLDQVYAFEEHIPQIYPGNSHVREKLRQQLQVLRDAGYLEFLGRGRYRRLKINT